MNNTKVQAIVYKIVEDKLFCLCLKRSIVDGGFWHVITGTLEGNETIKDCITREIREELGDHVILNISPKLKLWKWNKNGVDFDIVDLAIEINDGKIVLNNEHTEYAWLEPLEAEKIYDKDSAKEMVNLLNTYLANKSEKN